VTGFGSELGRCTALVVVCFRADGGLLLLAAAPPAPWELPYGPAPHPGSDLAGRAIPLVQQVSGVRLAAPPLLFGYIDLGPAAAPAGLAACLVGEVGQIGPLPRRSWARRRTFLPPADALAALPTDSWTTVRHACLDTAVAAYTATRDFWLLQPLDALTRADLDDVI
jgi:hypothetical protein